MGFARYVRRFVSATGLVCRAPVVETKLRDSAMKIKCTACKWIGVTDDVDRVEDPRGPDTWSVCPRCRTPENFVVLCDDSTVSVRPPAGRLRLSAIGERAMSIGRPPSPNFTRSPAKLLIFLDATHFCSHNISLIFSLTSAWVPTCLGINGGKIHSQTPAPHTRQPLPRIVVSARLDTRVIRIAYVVGG
jgi:hypothetical protein